MKNNRNYFKLITFLCCDLSPRLWSLLKGKQVINRLLDMYFTNLNAIPITMYKLSAKQKESAHKEQMDHQNSVAPPDSQFLLSWDSHHHNKLNKKHIL